MILPSRKRHWEIVGSTFRSGSDIFLPKVNSSGAHSMNLSAVLAFWGVCLLLIIVPGADWAFVVSAGLRGRSVVPAVGGLVLGYTVLTAVVAAGLGTLVARDPVLLTGLTVTGGGYLIWRGTATLATPPPDLPSEGRAAAPAAVGPTLARGLGVRGLNPQGLLLFLALLPP